MKSSYLEVLQYLPEHLHTFLKFQSTLGRRQHEALRDLGFAEFAEGEALSEFGETQISSSRY